jgi:hypothetical protein
MKFWPGVVPQWPRVVVEIDLTHREVVRGTPVGIHLEEQVGR